MAEEKKKKKRKIGTVENLKTATTARLHSKPRSEGQEYLEMWSLKRDQARWTRAKEQAQEKLENIDEAIEKVELAEAQDPASSDTPDEPGARNTIDFNMHAKQ